MSEEIAPPQSEPRVIEGAHTGPADAAEFSKIDNVVSGPSLIETPLPSTKSPFEKSLVVEVMAEDTIWGDKGEFWLEVEAELQRPVPLDLVVALATELKTLLDASKPIFRFDEYRAFPTESFVVVSPDALESPLWFIGDIHGDLLAFFVAQNFIEKTGQEGEPSTVFLGDLFDRGKFDKEVLYNVLKLIVDEPGKHAFVVGNHDEGLAFDGDKFSSSVQPCEFAEFLNERETDEAWRELARQAIRLFAHAPRAILLPDGLLIAHGGVPHIDRHDQIKSQTDLNDRLIGEDFVWTRIHESAKKKIPNRLTRGCSLGINDFNAFCTKLSTLLGRPVGGLIRGHDHLEKRYGIFEKYVDHPVLTINAMSHRYEGELFGDFDRPVIVARYIAGQMPTVHKVHVPKELTASIYAPPKPTEDR